MANMSITLRDTSGNAIVGWTVQFRLVSSGAVVSTTANGSVVDNANGSYTTNNDPDTGTYAVYACASGGTPALIGGYSEVRHFEFPLEQEFGGTARENASDARTALGLEIGADIQAHSDYLDDAVTSATALNIVNEDGIAAYDSGTDTVAFIPPALARTVLELTDSNATRALLGLEIGVDVQAYGSALESLDTKVSAATTDVFVTAASGTASTLEPSNARTTLGLGTSATVDTTDAGAINKIPIINSDSSITLPSSGTAISPAAPSLNRIQVVKTGDSTTGTYAIYINVITGASGGNYTYGRVTLYSSSWGGV